ncbi:hypothetical protein [Streptomyces sp. NPDC046197]|uniref:hypothetical protein n=1 Tax=Streptomyces sp. NPDC046197 TaxID=3154337 RepID=UPI0033F90A19
MLETVLAAALRGGDPGPEDEQRALAAFRAARSAGAHRARTRRRDDWRLPAERRTGRSVKMTFGVVFASLTLGGVAVAAIGSAGSSTGGSDAGRGTKPSAVAPDRPAGATSSASSGFEPTVGSARARDTEAHCRAHEQVKDHGKALDATAWQRLVAAAGGQDKVAAYCSEQLARATAAAGRPGNRGRPSDGNGNGTSGNTAAPGNAASHRGTGGTGGTGSAAGNGRAGDGKGSGKHK